MDKDKPKANVSKQIDENLRRVFQEKVEEEIPDRFKDLLDRLRQQGKSS